MNRIHSAHLDRYLKHEVLHKPSRGYSIQPKITFNNQNIIYTIFSQFRTHFRASILSLSPQFNPNLPKDHCKILIQNRKNMLSCFNQCAQSRQCTFTRSFTYIFRRTFFIARCLSNKNLIYHYKQIYTNRQKPRTLHSLNLELHLICI